MSGFSRAATFVLAVVLSIHFNKCQKYTYSIPSQNLPMKKSLNTLLIAAIVSVTAVCSYAAEAVSEAVVLKVKGNAHATIPGQSENVAVKVGDKLPQGSSVQTSGNSEVEIQVFSGSQTTIKPDTTVNLNKLSLTTENGAITKQTALIDLTTGSVVSSLDPSKKAINDYSIRTPKGVAAARGTVYTVTVAKDGVVRTFVARGVVVFFNPATGQSVTVQNGYTVTVGADGTISDPVLSTDAHLDAAKEQFKNDEDKNRAIDITIVSPSS